MRRKRISVGAALCAAGLAACVVDQSGAPGAKDTAAEVADSDAEAAPAASAAQPARAPAAPDAQPARAPDAADAQPAPDAADTEPALAPDAADVEPVPVPDAAPATTATTCDPADDFACRDHGGLCVPLAPGAPTYACAGQLGYTGHDDDDDVLYDGDTSRRTLGFEADADVFRLAVRAGRWRVLATPAAGVDLGFDVHDAYGALIGSFDDGVGGAPESITWNMTDGLGGFVVVRHVGGALGTYDLSVTSVTSVTSVASVTAGNEVLP